MGTEEKVKQFIQQHKMLSPGDQVIVGVSGGADSVCLLFLLCKLREMVPIQIKTVHVHHHLRQEEADGDAQFVKELCQAWQVPYTLCHCYVEEKATAEKISTEEAGRKARQEIFQRELTAWGGNKIALAHNQNDVAETMLYHLARGTGLDGLASLKPVENPMIRPLLCMNRQEIEHYLLEEHIKYVTDSTNLSDDYTRNKIRHHVLNYMMEEINEKTVSHMAATSGFLEEVQDYLNQQGQQAWDDFVSQPEENQICVKEELFQQHKVLQVQVLKMILKKLHAKRDVTAVHFRDLQKLAEKQVGNQVDLPGKMQAVRTYGGICIRGKETRSKIRQGNALKTEAVTLPVPGEVDLGELQVETVLVLPEHISLTEKKYTKWLDYDKIKGDLVLRTREKDDYIVVNSQGGKKKLKDYFIDCKIPRERRDQVLLLARDSEVFWVVGYRIGETCKIDEHTAQILQICVRGGQDE